jgi:carbonic anhydrase
MLIAAFSFSTLVMATGTEGNNSQGETKASPDEYITQTAKSQANMTPDEAIQMLKEGNERFVNNQMVNRNLLEQVEKTSTGQYPFAAVISCIDSRVPTEIIFDQGIGDIFNGRVAGNFVDEDMLGSLEFACKVAGSKAIVILGHSHCGAVKGACDNVELGNLTGMLQRIQPAVDAVTDVKEFRTSQNPEFVQKVADAHVELTVEDISENSSVLKEMIDNGEIKVVGAMYDIETGKVTFRD